MPTWELIFWQPVPGQAGFPAEWLQDMVGQVTAPRSPRGSSPAQELSGSHRGPPVPQFPSLRKQHSARGCLARRGGNQLLVSIPRGQTDALSPHGRVTCPGMLARLQLQPPPCTSPPGDRPAPRRARGQRCLAGCPHQARGARGQPEWAVTVPCAGWPGSEEEALLDVEEGSGRVRGHSWGGSGRD